MKKLLLSSFILLFLYSCTTTMNVQNASKNNAPLEKIESNKLICIVGVNDGIYNGKVYAGSGLYVLNSFTLNLQPFASKIKTVDANNYEADAEQLGATYIVKPIIMHWEPRNASWSGIPTRVEINVSVFDLEQDKYIIYTNLSATGRAVTLVDQSAEGLANEIIREFVQSITK
jgi:hypothetical protein